MEDIVTIGSATRDVFLKSDAFTLLRTSDSPTGAVECVPMGTKIDIKEMVFSTGGGGTNTAVTFARQGFSTACVGVVGHDASAEDILFELKKEGVNTQYIQTHTDLHTAYSVILVHTSGERTILSYKGEGQHFNVSNIPFDSLSPQWFYINSLGGHEEILKAAIDRAMACGAKVTFNPGGKELEMGIEKYAQYLAQVDIFIINREEAMQFTRTSGDDDRGAWNKLQQYLKGIIVVTDGPRGVAVRSAGKEYRAGTPESPRVDATGAGDAFGSGFVTELIRTNDITKAIQFGTANASSVVAQFGAKAGILYKDKDLDAQPIDVQITNLSL